MKIKSSGILIFQALVLSLCLSTTASANKNEISENIYGKLTATQCDSLIQANETNPNFVILDVRTEGEWSNYHIEGSIFRDARGSAFDDELNALPKHKIFLMHCQSGGRSAGAFAKMKQFQFAEVYEMISGINSWNSKGLPTTKIVEPKLMLVATSEVLTGGISDTIKVTLTNRANGNLTFTASSFTDLHQIDDNFNQEVSLEGAQDYTFSIVHSPVYSGDDSTKISVESNGGNIDIDVVFKNGTIVGIEDQQLAKITVYPNPANQRLYLKNAGLAFFDEISVINLLGQKVLFESQISISNGIDVSNFKNGIYFLRLKYGNQIISQKFIVRH